MSDVSLIDRVLSFFLFSLLLFSLSFLKKIFLVFGDLPCPAFLFHASFSSRRLLAVEC